MVDYTLQRRVRRSVFRDVHILRCVRITASKYYIYTAIKVL